MHTYEQLGRIVLDTYGARTCLEGYLTDDPYWVGRYALGYGDIDRDGRLS